MNEEHICYAGFLYSQKWIQILLDVSGEVVTYMAFLHPVKTIHLKKKKKSVHDVCLFNTPTTFAPNKA